MIKQSSFSQKWINAVSEKYQYHDRNLIEKVIGRIPFWKCWLKKAARQFGKAALH